MIAIHGRDTTAAIVIETAIDARTHTIVTHDATGAGVACPAYHEGILVDVMADQ